MKLITLLTALFSAAFSMAHPFHKWEQIQDFYKSGFTKCSVYSENTLRAVWIKNTNNHSVQIINVSDAVEIEYGPKYDENYFVFNETIYYLGTQNRVDSSSTVHYSGRFISDDNTETTFNLNNQFSVFLYDPYNPLKLIFKKNYYLFEGQKIFKNYDFYEYDFNGRLLSWTDQQIITDNTTTSCVVNELGQIIESELEDRSFCSNYIYDDSGRLSIIQTSKTLRIFSYNKYGLIERESFLYSYSVILLYEYE
jgi:hypothetical protein